MCGIVGGVNYESTAITQTGLNIILQMLHADAVRGMHGTGLYAVDKEGSNMRIRVGGPPYELVGSKEFEKYTKFVQQKFVRFMVGHNRFATRGSHTTEHAHPFRDGHITMVHNGTLDSFGHLPDAKDYQVDSEAICHAFAVDGVEKTIKTLKGAWTLVWWDNKAQTLNFLRNSKRPLWIAPHKTDHSMFFASEGHMLQWILQRNNWDYKEIKQLPENQWWSFPLGDSKPNVKELHGAKETAYDEQYWEAWKQARDLCGINSDVSTDSNIIPFQQKKTYPVAPLPVSTQTPAGSQNTKATSTDTEYNKRGYLLDKRQGQKKANTASTSGGGAWVGVKHLHDLSEGDHITIWPETYKIIDTERGHKEGLYHVRGFLDEYPDVEFFVNIKGEAALLLALDAPEGIRGKIASIMRSMNNAATNPHKIILQNPEPMYVVEPDDKVIQAAES